MDLLADLRNRCNNLILNSNNKEKYIIIRHILEPDDCFFKMDTATAIGILLDLGVLKENVFDYYKELVSVHNFRI